MAGHGQGCMVQDMGVMQIPGDHDFLISFPA
jgi:hypothetical protein